VNEKELIVGRTFDRADDIMDFHSGAVAIFGHEEIPFALEAEVIPPNQPASEELLDRRPELHCLLRKAHARAVEELTQAIRMR